MSSPTPPSPERGWLLGSDIGGTFTDLFFFHEATERIALHKVPSTPTDPSQGLLAGIQGLLEREHVAAGAVARLIHGTTVATNALLEHKGVRTGLITTRGFRDLLEIRRQRRPSLYDLFFDKPAPLVARHLRCEVTERCDAQGNVVIPLERSEVEDAITRLKAAGVEAIAVCFLFAYLNPGHEQQVASMLRARYPEVYVCLSSEVLPEWREFERLSTTTANAYLGPVMKRYLERVRSRTASLGIPATPRVMQSNGGIMSLEAAADRAVATLLSGPSAGVIGAQYLAMVAGFPHSITFDMGGTSTDVSLLQNGAPRFTTEQEIAGTPVKVPMIDIHTVGAGGGSVAWLTEEGLLKVGPQSMGAHPGPACYGLGGSMPTVTDMNVVLGRLHPSYLLGGRMPIRAELAHQVIAEKVARPLGMELAAAAAGMLTIINTNMVLATRLISIQRGYDPRDFTLVAFGGAGPLHAAAVAQELHIATLLIPPSPGTVCAWGLLVADTRADYVQTRTMLASQADLAEIDAIFAHLEAQAMSWLEGENVPPGQRHCERHIDMRYSKQNYELSVPARPGPWQDASQVELLQRFHTQHQQTYGYAATEEPVQLVTFRVTAIGLTRRPQIKPAGTRRGTLQPLRERQVYFQETGGFVACPIFARTDLAVGDRLQGPAIIEQMDATTVMHPGHYADVDDYGNLIIHLG